MLLSCLLLSQTARIKTIEELDKNDIDVTELTGISRRSYITHLSGKEINIKNLTPRPDADNKWFVSPEFAGYILPDKCIDF